MSQPPHSEYCGGADRTDQFRAQDQHEGLAVAKSGADPEGADFHLLHLPTTSNSVLREKEVADDRAAPT